jgi:mRNA interferase MazF
VSPKPPPEPLRGQVWFVEVLAVGQKPVVVVSNNRRNRALPTVLAVRITSAPKVQLPTIVELPKGEPVVGRVLCDDVLVIAKQRMKRPSGALSQEAMERIEGGLRVALSLD